MRQLNMLTEIKKNKHFYIALALVVLVPFAVYWITAGHDVAIRNLAAALTLLFTTLIYLPKTIKRQHSPNQANLEAHNSFLGNSSNSFAAIKRGGDSAIYSKGFVKREQSITDRIKSLLLGENHTP